MATTMPPDTIFPQTTVPIIDDRTVIPVVPNDPPLAQSPSPAPSEIRRPEVDAVAPYYWDGNYTGSSEVSEETEYTEGGFDIGRFPLLFLFFAVFGGLHAYRKIRRRRRNQQMRTNNGAGASPESTTTTTTGVVNATTTTPTTATATVLREPTVSEYPVPFATAHAVTDGTKTTTTGVQQSSYDAASYAAAYNTDVPASSYTNDV